LPLFFKVRIFHSHVSTIPVGARYEETGRVLAQRRDRSDGRLNLDFSVFFTGDKCIMSKNIYVGNLPWSATEQDVETLFATYGQVANVKLISDRETGRARGFGFVEMESGAEEAIAALDGADYGGRSLKVNEARPRPERERRPRW